MREMYSGKRNLHPLKDFYIYITKENYYNVRFLNNSLQSSIIFPEYNLLLWWSVNVSKYRLYGSIHRIWLTLKKDESKDMAAFYRGDTPLSFTCSRNTGGTPLYGKLSDSLIWIFLVLKVCQLTWTLYWVISVNMIIWGNCYRSWVNYEFYRSVHTIFQCWGFFFHQVVQHI